jgi:hypothetical protein
MTVPIHLRLFIKNWGAWLSLIFYLETSAVPTHLLFQNENWGAMTLKKIKAAMSEALKL